jgi:hypothetical protein
MNTGLKEISNLKEQTSQQEIPAPNGFENEQIDIPS